MNKVLPQAVKQRTWPILKEGFHPSTVILQQETPFWTVLHHFKGREKSQYIMDRDADYSVFYLLYIDNCSLKGKHDFWLQNHNQHFHLLTALARRVGVKTQYSCTYCAPYSPPPSPATALRTTSTAAPCVLALLVCSDPQVFISCPVPTQIIQKVKCRLPFCVVTNLSTLSFSSVIHIDINGETNMCVTEQRQTKINEKECGHQKPIIHSKLHSGNHRSVEIK